MKRVAKYSKSTPVIATWYRTDNFVFELEEVEVLEIKPKTLIIRDTFFDGAPKRTNIATRYDHYWATRDEAIAHFQARLDALRDELTDAVQDLQKIIESP